LPSSYWLEQPKFNKFTRDGHRTDIFAYIEIFFYRIRNHSCLDNLAPMEFERKELVRLEVAGAKLVPVHQTG